MLGLVAEIGGPQGEMMRQKREIGQAATVQLPVQEETAAPEVLKYPDCDDEPIAQHQRQLWAIFGAFDRLTVHFHFNPEVHVRGDMFVYYRKLLVGMEPRQASVTPNVFVVKGVKEAPESSYRIWEVGVVPQFVLEVASRPTYRRDLDEKYEIYERLGFQEYFWFDPMEHLEGPEDPGKRLRGWRLGSHGRYEQLEAESGGLMRSEELELDLCVQETTLRFWDYAKGRFVRGRWDYTDS